MTDAMKALVARAAARARERLRRLGLLENELDAQREIRARVKVGRRG